MAEPEQIGEIIESKSEILKSNSDSTVVVEKGKNGGARPGAGRPKGKVNRKTLEKMKVKAAMEQRIMLHLDDLLNAQMQLATGEQVLMVKMKDRDSKGKVIRTYFEQVTDKELIKQYLDYEVLGEGENPSDEDAFYFLSTKSADNKALDSLINRVMGKVPEKLEVEGGFFSQKEIRIKVVGSQHADIEIGDDGQLITGTGDSGSDTGADAERTPGDGDRDSEPSPSS